MSSLSRQLAALGPLAKVQETLVTQLTTQAEITLCLSDPRRWYLEIWPPSVPPAAYRVSTVSGNVAIRGGVVVGSAFGSGNQGLEQFQREVRKSFTLCQQTWYGGIDGGAAPVSNAVWTVIEVLFLPGG